VYEVTFVSLSCFHWIKCICTRTMNNTFSGYYYCFFLFIYFKIKLEGTASVPSKARYCANVQMCKCANVQMCKCANAQMRKCANVQMCKCANVQMCKCANAQMCKCANVQMCKCAVPTDHLRSQSSFSRTKNSPNLMSYIGRTALATPDC